MRHPHIDVDPVTPVFGQRATRAEIEAVARDAQADGFIRALPDGYETVIGERGVTLPGGQRLAIA